MQLILGSQSPRRREILSYFSLPFTQVFPVFDEESIIFTNHPEEYVCAIACGKAASLSQEFSQSMILTADTIVFCEGKIYGKPKNEEVAIQALSELVGKWHTVYTGVTLQQGMKAVHQAEATHVLFNQITTPQIRHYVKKTNWSDKAGGYAIQMAGGLLVNKIDGCYYNVMGLPINTLEKLLKHFGIELWDYL